MKIKEGIVVDDDYPWDDPEDTGRTEPEPEEDDAGD